MIGLLGDLLKLGVTAARALPTWWRCGASFAERRRRWRAFTALHRTMGEDADAIPRAAYAACVVRGLKPADMHALIEMAAREAEAGADVQQLRQRMRETAELWAIIEHEHGTEAEHGRVECED